MSDTLVRIEKDGIVGLITIDRPKALNALNPTVLGQLREALLEAAADNDVLGIIITGGGDRSFVAGADIATMVDMKPEQGFQFAEQGLSTLQMIEDIPKPVIAAVNGFALGGGLELALACDIIYASPKALLGLPEVTLGIMPGFGGTQRLSRLIGSNRAKEMIFTGKKIDAATAKCYGIVQEVVEDEDLIAFCKGVINKIGRVGPMAVAQTKRAINKGTDLALDAGLAVEKMAFMSLFSSYDKKEGMTAFLEKRKPEFRGE